MQWFNRALFYSNAFKKFLQNSFCFSTIARASSVVKLDSFLDSTEIFLTSLKIPGLNPLRL